MGKVRMNRNIFELFMRLLPVQIFLVVASGLGDMVNGMVVGNCLSPLEMNATGLSAPLGMLLSSIANIICSGSLILCGQHMGRGESKKVDQLFSIAHIALFVIGAALTILCFSFAGWIASFLGASSQSLVYTTAYIRGISLGIIPLLMIPCLMGFLQMCNRSSISLSATLMLAFFNTVFSLISVKGFHSGVFGVGAATSLSRALCALFMIFYFMKKKDLISFNTKDFDMKILANMIVIGSPSSLAGILYSFRNMMINQNAFLTAGDNAVNSLAILGSCDSFFDCFNVGVGSVMTMLASVFIGERDSRSLKELMKTAFIIGMILCTIKISFAYLFSDHIVALFGAKGELVSAASTLLVFYVFCGFFNIVTLIFMGVYQSLGRSTYCNLLYPVNCIIVPFFCCKVLSKIYGIKGIWAAYTLAEIATILCMYLYACVKEKGLVKNIDEMLFLDKNFDTETKLTMSIDQIEEVIDVSKKIQDFCKLHGIENRRAMLSGLCMEEMAGNIVEHGFTKDKKKHLIDVFACVENDEVFLRLRDNCIPFDPHSRMQMYDEKDPAKNIGIRMVGKIAREMNYQTTFGMNVLSIRL